MDVCGISIRYNKQVLKAFHFPFTCTNLQVRPLSPVTTTLFVGSRFAAASTQAAKTCRATGQHQGLVVKLQLIMACSRTYACAQFAVGSALALVMWTLNLHSKPKVDKDLVRGMPPSSFCKAVGRRWRQCVALETALIQ